MKSLLRYALRYLRGNLGRFFALSLIVMLSLSLFIGVKAVAKDMRVTAEKYFDDYSLMDFRLRSTLGFTQEDAAAVAGVSGVRAAMPSHALDVSVEAAGEGSARLISFPDESSGYAIINRPYVIEGKVPQNGGECVVDAGLCEQMGIKPGDVITVTPRGAESPSGRLKSTSLTVSGIAGNPMNISKLSGGGAGLAENPGAFIMAPESAFDDGLYSEIFILAAGSEGLPRLSEEYTSLLAPVMEALVELGEQRADMRYDQYIEEAERELETLKSELYREQQSLVLAEGELDAQRLALNEDEQVYAADLVSYNTEINATQQQLWSTKSQLDQTAAQLAERELALADEGAQLAVADEELAPLRQEVTEKAERLEELSAQISMLDEQLLEYTPDDQMFHEIAMHIAELQTQHATVAAELAPVQEQLLLLEDQLAALQQDFDLRMEQYESERAVWNARMSEYNRDSREFERFQEDELIRLTDERRNLDARWAGYNADRAEYEERSAQAQPIISSLRRKIADAEAGLQLISQPKWSITGLESNEPFAQFRENCDMIEAVGGMYPLLMLAAAAIMCVVAALRAVAGDRKSIGALRAMGLGGAASGFGHVFFAAAAALCGGGLGLLAGYFAMPPLIYGFYRDMYVLPQLRLEFDAVTALIAAGAALLFMVLAAVVALAALLRKPPAMIMDSRRRRLGGSIMMSAAPLWKSLGFVQKIAARNILRHKRRLAASLLITAACSSMLFVGVNLYKSVSDVATDQFERILQFDAYVTLAGNTGGDHESTVINMKKDYNVTAALAAYVRTLGVRSGGVERTAELVVPKEEGQLSRYIRLYDRGTGEAMRLRGGGVVVSAKLADLLAVNTGGTVEIPGPGGGYTELAVMGVTENYYSHYIYMTVDTYMTLPAADYAPNRAYVQMRDDSESARDKTVDRLLAYDDINGVVLNDENRASFEASLQALERVTMVMMAFAAALSLLFVYSLSSINMAARSGEAKAARAIGLLDSEISHYMSLEIIFITVIGAILGLCAAYPLCRLLLPMAEVEAIMLRYSASVWTLVLSAAAVVVLTVAVCLFSVARRIKRQGVRPLWK